MDVHTSYTKVIANILKNFAHFSEKKYLKLKRKKLCNEN